MREKSSAALSVKRSETVRGYEVKRLPLGEYLRAMEALRDMPQTVMRVCFPEMDGAQMLQSLTKIDAKGLAQLVLRAMDVVPDEAIRLLSILTGVPEDTVFEISMTKPGHDTVTCNCTSYVVCPCRFNKSA